jgi:hypothetical protein
MPLGLLGRDQAHDRRLDGLPFDLVQVVPIGKVDERGSQTPADED